MRRAPGLPFLLLVGGIAWAGVHVVAHRAADAGAAHGVHGHAHDAGAAGYLPTSLSLCLSLAVVLAATSSAYPRWRGASGRALWLFGAVPLLGLFAGALAESGGFGGLEADLAGLLPVAGLVLVVQVAVAFTAVRAARSFLELVAAALGVLAGPRTARSVAALAGAVPLGADAPPPSLLAVGGGPRGPPALPS